MEEMTFGENMSGSKLLGVAQGFVPMMLAVGFFLSFVYEFTFFYFFGIDFGLLPVSVPDLLRIPFFYAMPILIFSVYFYFSLGTYIGKKRLEKTSYSFEDQATFKKFVVRLILILIFYILNIFLILKQPSAISCSFVFFVSGMLFYDLVMLRYRKLLISAYGHTAQVCFSLLLAFSWITASLAIYDASEIVIENDSSYKYILESEVVNGSLLRSYDNTVVIYEKDSGSVIFIRHDNNSVSKLKIKSHAINLIEKGTL